MTDSQTIEKTDSEKLITELNFRNEIIDERLEGGAVSTEKMLEILPETVVDKRTLRVVEIHKLFKAVDHTETYVGSAHLAHSLMNPSESIEQVYAKQDAFCELASNVKLQEAINEFLVEFRKGEDDIFRFLNAHMHPMTSYGDYKRAMAAIERMMALVKKIPQPETVYLDSMVKSILSFNGSVTREMVQGPVYRTLHGLRSRSEKTIFHPGLRFYPSRIGAGLIVPAIPFMYFGAAWLFGFMNQETSMLLFLMTGVLSVMGGLYGALLKPLIDYETGVLPVREMLIESNRFGSAIEAVAAIDELLSFVRFAEEMPHPTTMPEITNESSHFFVARDLRNPVSAKEKPDFVANDVKLTGARMSFITGPNSGGKTTFCKTIVQNQILAQIGAPVVASAAMINMSDKITYQAPAFDTLADDEGRFGTELKMTRDIFYSVTPRSLTILDEIAEGTTTNEKITLSVDIMKGFYAVGNNTLLVTHSHELVDSFKAQGQGQYLNVEFKDGEPTHRMVPGISRDSHAARVAQKIGFSPEDIQRYLKKQGYV
jgi:DNA mismatch repair ATPase MutS